MKFLKKFLFAAQYFLIFLMLWGKGSISGVNFNVLTETYVHLRGLCYSNLIVLNVVQCIFLFSFLHSVIALCKFKEPLWYKVSIKDSNGT